MTDSLLSARDYVEVRFAGSGGQGVILMGVILALAATRDRRHVVQTQSYGPEARGGYSRSDVIIANKPVDYPQLQGIDLLVALSAQAVSRYAHLLNRQGIFIYDEDEVADLSALPASTHAHGVPFSRLALEETGRTQTTNILALGAVCGITGVVSAASLEKAALSLVPPGTEDVNLRALRRGLRVGTEV
ncbi:MAG: 2-oxoacid:acceptor oxidoreductase family protein [Thermoleophilia bacterium]